MRKLLKPDPLRQSYIARGDQCMLSLKFDLLGKRRSPSMLAARGSLFHAWVAAALQLMVDQKEPRIPVEMGLELLHKVCAQRDVPAESVIHLPMSETEMLRALVTTWCQRKFIPNVHRIVGIEGMFGDPLVAEIDVPGPNGTTYRRAISGRPDLLVADPPEGMVIPDWKAGFVPPKKKRDSDPYAKPREERLSDHGYRQQVVYGILVLAYFPAVQAVTLRENYAFRREHGQTILDWSEYRENTVHRWQLERYTDIVAERVALIDAALDEGARSQRWFPTAGEPQCGFCPDPLRCPIRPETHVPASDEEAQRLFHTWHVSGEQRKRAGDALKAYLGPDGALDVEHDKRRLLLGWHGNRTGDGRTFGLYEPEEIIANPFETELA